MEAEKINVVAYGTGGAREVTRKSGKVVVRNEKGEIMHTKANRESRLAWLKETKLPVLEVRVKKVKKVIKDLEKDIKNDVFPETL